MRLLHTKTLELHEFFGAEIPPYAILSHTWGEGEVSFQELRSSGGKNKAGYDKIRGCCEMAVSDGFQYVWVDTCCIDKTSSAELSEAINSMYNWYRLSDVCYVYLPDVPANLGTKATEDAIRKSRWFTRGWTLQELIAPSGVIFFDSKWGDLGTKESLETVITDITKIKGEVLRDANNMGEFSVAQKMTSLIGIFGVNMPMLYGEGDQAFIRLQEEIMKSELDHSIFAWTGTSYFSPGLLAPAPACFTNSGNIVQFENQAASPFTSANKGIHLHLPLKAIDRPVVHLAVLDCYEIIGRSPQTKAGKHICQAGANEVGGPFLPNLLPLGARVEKKWKRN
ncbi:heterokaryon incompatibility protein-domain-containing protein [Hyaloscypha sp. PMI_1271]|nr:heterokaryon incompatibility protein-domain-containing protein [Hyaloscypha sp. PMI_1271]